MSTLLRRVVVRGAGRCSASGRWRANSVAGVCPQRYATDTPLKAAAESSSCKTPWAQTQSAATWPR